MNKFFFSILAILLLASFQATAGDMEHHGITVEQAWARASAGAAKTGAGYVTLSNHGTEVDRLIDVKSDLAARTEIHTHAMENDIMRMTRVEGGVEVAPGSPTVFKPGGLHIMFMGLHEGFVEGQHLPLTLVFEHAGEIEVELVVLGVGATEPQDHGTHNHSHGS